jgi:hypothetical protein
MSSALDDTMHILFEPLFVRLRKMPQAKAEEVAASIEKAGMFDWGTKSGYLAWAKGNAFRMQVIIPTEPQVEAWRHRFAQDETL